MLKTEKKEDNSLRYEKKFVVLDYSEHETEMFVKSNKFLFREIFEPRYVNNIYFDYMNFSSFFENIDGEHDREKTRIRWYGLDIKQADSPQLEFKIKRGLLGSKEIYKMKNFNLDSNLENIVKNNDFDKRVFLKLTNQKPILINRYKRKYFISADKKFRITIDTNLHFYFIAQNKLSLNKKISDSGKIIVELKYEKEYENQAKQISSELPFRLSKNSKYLTGVNYMLNY